MKKVFHRFWFILYDFLAAVLAWNGFYYVRKVILQEELSFSLEAIVNSLFIGVFWIVIYSMFGVYLNLYQKSRVREIFLVILLAIPGTLILFFVLFLDDEGIIRYQNYYQTLGAYFSIHVFLAILSKALVLSYVKTLIKKKKIVFNTLVIGSNQRATETYKDVVKINKSLGSRVMG